MLIFDGCRFPVINNPALESSCSYFYQLSTINENLMTWKSRKHSKVLLLALIVPLDMLSHINQLYYNFMPSFQLSTSNDYECNHYKNNHSTILQPQERTRPHVPPRQKRAVLSGNHRQEKSREDRAYQAVKIFLYGNSMISYVELSSLSTGILART